MKREKVKVPFDFPMYRAFIHAHSDFYIAGGKYRGDSINTFRKITPEGLTTQLSSMLQKKDQFGITFDPSSFKIFTLGGFFHQNYGLRLLDEVSSFCLIKKVWNNLEPFPIKVGHSGLLSVNRECLYTIGGFNGLLNPHEC